MSAHPRTGRLALAAATLCVAGALAAEAPADAGAPGPGSWTRVTTPSGRTTLLSQVGHEGQLTVAGKASSDISLVNVYCLRGIGSAVDATTVATSVPVAGGRFQATVPVPQVFGDPVCRLRALPAGVNPQTTYLASYAGPVTSFDAWRYTVDAGVPYAFTLTAAAGDGELQGGDAASCLTFGTVGLQTVQPDLTITSGLDGCLVALDTAVGETASGIRVDGHNAFTPGSRHQWGLTATPISVRVSASPSGRVTWSETAKLARCASGDAFPPSSSTCPTLVQTGVSLHRVATYLANGQQVTARDSFTSTDGRRHHVRLAYAGSLADQPGEPGVWLPGQHAFHAVARGTTTTALGHAAASMLLRTDRFSVEGDPTASTFAVSWSRTPSRATFDAASDAWETLHTLTVPSKGTVRLGYAVSEATTTAQARTLAHHAERAMLPAPRIATPADGAVVSGRSTTVSGTVRAGADGLPTSVTVDGHRATLVARSATRATFRVTFLESLGTHTLTAVARDAGGNARSSSVTVRNA